MFESVLEKIVAADDLPGLRQKHRSQILAFATGCFDIFQSGHSAFFSQCKYYCDVLVVGIGRDSTVRILKGEDHPINPERNRLFTVASNMNVDYALLNDLNIGEGKIDFADVISRLEPDSFILPENDSGIREKRQLCESLKIKLISVPRIVPVGLTPTSSSNIIDKIQFGLRAPLRIDFAGGWTDIPYLIQNKTGYVSNIAIQPHVELRRGHFNYGGHPRGTGLSTSTAVEVLRLIKSKGKDYLTSKTLVEIAEDLFDFENQELSWAIGRQDQYSIVFGGFNCFEFGQDYAKPLNLKPSLETLEDFKKGLVLIYSGISRNAQLVVEQVYNNFNSGEREPLEALDKIGACGLEFAQELQKGNFENCAEIMERNWRAQIQLASKSTTPEINEMYAFARYNGALGGKMCGASGGGCFVFYSPDPKSLTRALKSQFPQCFELDFDFEYKNIKDLNPY